VADRADCAYRADAEHRIFAVRYGSTPGRTRFENLIFRDPADCGDPAMPMDFFVWAVIGDAGVILVDTGSAAPTMTARGHGHLRSPIAALADVGLSPAQVTDVITTHLHWDHGGNIDDVPDARLHIQRAELAHAAGPAMCSGFLRRPYDIGQLHEWMNALYAGRVVFHDGDDEIAPGVSIHHVGGHTPGMQVVRVRTARGNVVLASDAMHYYENRAAENPFPVLVSTIDYIEALHTVDRLADGPDHVIPGHDPLVLARYPAAADSTVALHLEPTAVAV
jgi:glyoxylase-like metal-dependent hydrolase (beta-lactamase superfamily II)